MRLRSEVGGRFDVGCLRAHVQESEEQACQKAKRPLPRPRAPSGAMASSNGWSQVGGRDVKFSLHTSDPAVARSQLKAERERIVAAVHHDGGARATFEDVLEAWSEQLPQQVSRKTAVRYSARRWAPDAALARGLVIWTRSMPNSSPPSDAH